jgi:hypothetical protein
VREEYVGPFPGLKDKKNKQLTSLMNAAGLKLA